MDGVRAGRTPSDARAAYFFRSLRFQHAVWESALSFVMSVSVV
jgi:hypothetical protein